MNSIELAWKIRRDAIEMVHASHASHIGSILSIADILAVLYASVINVNKSNIDSPYRDRFILSKGHAGAAVYSVLSELGFFDKSLLKTYYTDGSVLSGHVSHKNVPGVEFSTGSLGHGIAVASGMALYSKMHKAGFKVFTVVGDGELNEGSVWETAINAPGMKLDNFTVIVDRNKMQAMGNCNDIINLEPISDKWKSLGWNVINVPNGHDHHQLLEAFNSFQECKPKCIIANTIKGKGISFMENSLVWHYKDPQGDFYSKAIEELERDRP